MKSIKNYNNGKRSINEIFFLEALDVLRKSFIRLSREEEELILKLAKKYNIG
jgi:hypothetical protein